MTADTARDESISNLRFICIFLMTFAHNYFAFNLIQFKSAPFFSVSHSPMAYLNYVIFYGLSRISSPLLGFLSGYFASATLANRSYQRVLYEKLRSLYVPAIFWSLAYFLVLITGAWITENRWAVQKTLSAVDLEDFLGITKFPLNYPLHYLIDLFKCIILAPFLIYAVRRTSGIAFIMLTLFIFLALTGSDLNHFIPGQHAYDIWPRADLAMFFSFGLLAQRSWRAPAGDALMRFRATNFLVLFGLLVVFLLGTFDWPWLARENSTPMVWAGAITLLATRIAGVMLLLASLGWLRKIAKRGFYISDRVTFILFCTHVISYFIFNEIIRLNHLPAHDLFYFYFAPFFELGMAVAVFGVQQHLKRFLDQLPAPRQSIVS